MKILLIPFLFFVATAKGQNCDGYFPMEKGAIMESTTYNDKDKVQSTITITIKDVQNEKNEVKLSIHSDIVDEKSKPVASADYDARCSGGNFYISMKSMLSAEQMKTWKDMTVTMDAEDIVYPLEAAPGTTLPDAHLKVSVSMSGMNMPGTTIDVTNRRVVARESITTPAGTFDCIKVTSDVKLKSIVGYEVQTVEWLSKGNGVIKSESYKKEKLKSYTLLTHLKR